MQPHSRSISGFATLVVWEKREGRSILREVEGDATRDCDGIVSKDQDQAGAAVGAGVGGCISLFLGVSAPTRYEKPSRGFSVR